MCHRVNCAYSTHLLVIHSCLLRPCAPCAPCAGVLTKLDIMDRGTNAAHILRGQLIPLRMGAFVG